MAKYDVTCPECGATYVVALFGKHDQREWKLKNFDWTCETCKAKARVEADKAAAVENQEEGLPVLTGSEKQVLWAEKIRRDQIDATRAKVDELIAKRAESSDEAARKNGFRDLADVKACILRAFEEMCGQASAHWWIENRSLRLLETFISPRVRAILKERKEKAPEVLEAAVEITLRPESPVTETVAEIITTETSVRVSFPEKRDDFREAIKGIGFHWTGGCWQNRHALLATTSRAKAAEAGAVLLAAGFVVRVPNPDVRADIVAGNVQHENTRVVSRRVGGDYNGWFALVWTRKDGDFYDKAKRLPGAKYSKPAVVVRSEHFEEVLDFAEIHGFSLSPGAKELVETAQAARANALRVTPVVQEHASANVERPKLDPAGAGEVEESLLDN